MTKELVPYGRALELNKLGFDEPCFVRVWWLNSINRHTKESYKPQITMNGHDIKFDYPIPEKHPLSEFDVLELQVPTFSRAFRFFREKYGLYSHVRESYSFDNTLEFVSQINGNYVNHGIFDKPVNRFYSYEEAESACLDKLIEIAKKIKENDDMISSDIVGY